MNTVVLFPDGSWEHETNVYDLNTKLHAKIRIGDGWSDRQIAQLLSDYYDDGNMDIVYDYD